MQSTPAKNLARLGALEELLRRWTGVLRGLMVVPALATQDWSARAAAVLTGIAPDCDVTVAVGSVSASGQVQRLDGVGRVSRTSDGAMVRRSRSELRPTMQALVNQQWHPSAQSGTGAATLTADMLRASRHGIAWQLGVSHRLLCCAVRSELRAGSPFGALTLMVFVQAPVGVDEDTAHAMLRVASELLAEKASIAANQEGRLAWLTGRESEVLDMLIQGLPLRAIGLKLGLSEHTVHDHVKKLHRKVGAHSRAELVARALGVAPPTVHETGDGLVETTSGIGSVHNSVRGEEDEEEQGAGELEEKVD